MTDKTKDHDRIWLEPAGAPDRCWCSDNQWGDEGIEYVRADLAQSLRSSQAGEVEVRTVAWLGTNLECESEPFLSQHQAEFWSNGASKVEPLITLASHQSVIAVLSESLDQWDAWAEGLSPAEIDAGMKKLIAAKDAEIAALRRQLDEKDSGNA